MTADFSGNRAWARYCDIRKLVKDRPMEAAHTGYHNDSRWIAFAQCHPEWVQCIEHSMSHPAFYSMPQRRPA